MTKGENQIKQRATEKGYEVLRNGWPDFLLYKVLENKAVFVEVKSKKDKISKSQKRMAEVLKKLGLLYQIVWID